MKVVILAGGFGTRISEETVYRPKPMIEIGEKPILWHIMKYYSFYGFNDFIICAGYKQHVIKQFFADYFFHTSDIIFDFTLNADSANHIQVLQKHSEPWKVTVVDTGLSTLTGGRIKRIKSFITEDDFMLTYGDGLSDVNLQELLSFHKSNNKIATLTAVQPGGRFGRIDINSDNLIRNFAEKKIEDGGWINGGFMVLNQKVFDYIDGDNTPLEEKPLERLCRDNQLLAFKHYGFWRCMDTLRDRNALEDLLRSGTAPWKIWEN